MKKATKLLSVLLCVVLITSLFSACSPNGKAIMSDTYANYDNLAKASVTIKPDGKEISSFKLSGKAEENNYVTVDLGKKNRFQHCCVKGKRKKSYAF